MSPILILDDPATHAPLAGVELPEAAWTPAARSWLPLPLLGLIADLHRELEPERRALLAARERRQAAWDQGELPGYLDDEVAREARGRWRIAALPPDLLRRRVEITGPVDSTKMVIQMLSRGEDGARADCAMLDFEDSMKPEWPRVLAGFANLAGAAHGDLAWRQPAEAGKPEKVYRLDPADLPVVMVRCRGLHLDEANLSVDGEPVAAGLLDLAGAVYHSAEALLERGRTPKYYVPKCEHHLEACWWGRLFSALEGRLGLEPGCLRVTLLIETLPAAFQMEEILWQLRDRITALNVGRWDKIFSDIKTLKARPDRVLADRATISLERPWMRAYAERLVQVCHRHGAFGMGGMAAFTPGKSAERRTEQTAKVLADKRFEHALGHDGCWVSHPYFIAPALSAFPEENQLRVIPDLPERPELLPAGGGPYTEAGLRKNLRVGIAYLEGWRRGLGCVAWDDLMEDLATLEISRAQTWQWLHHRVRLEDGTEVTRALVRRLFAEEEAAIAEEIRAALADPLEAEAAAGRFAAAREEAVAIFTETELRPFLARASERMGG